MFAHALPALEFDFVCSGQGKGVRSGSGGTDSDSGMSATSDVSSDAGGINDDDTNNDDMLARMSAFLDEFDEGSIHEVDVTHAAGQRRPGHPGGAAPRRARPAPLNLSSGLSSLGASSSPAVSSPFSTIRLAPDTPTTPLTPFSDLRVPAPAPPSGLATAAATAGTPGTPTAALLQPLSELFADPKRFDAADVSMIAHAILQAGSSPATPDGSAGMFFPAALALQTATAPPAAAAAAAAVKKRASGPRATYLQLCALALGEVGDEATVTSLYAWIEQSHPALCTSKYWKNAVRHALSASPYFEHDGNIGNSRWSLDPAVRLDLANCPAGTTPRYLADKRKELRSLKSRKRRSADLTDTEFALVPSAAVVDSGAGGDVSPAGGCEVAAPAPPREAVRPGSPSQRRRVDEALESLAQALA